MVEPRMEVWRMLRQLRPEIPPSVKCTTGSISPPRGARNPRFIPMSLRRRPSCIVIRPPRGRLRCELGLGAPPTSFAGNIVLGAAALWWPGRAMPSTICSV